MTRDRSQAREVGPDLLTGPMEILDGNQQVTRAAGRDCKLFNRRSPSAPPDLAVHGSIDRLGFVGLGKIEEIKHIGTIRCGDATGTDRHRDGGNLRVHGLINRCSQ